MSKSLNKDNLLEILEKIDAISNEEWQASLNQRKKEELDFHNKDRDQKRINESKAEDTFEKFYGNKKYYSTTKRSFQYFDNWIKEESPNNVLLDYACGNGGNAIKAAIANAELAIGIDISDVSIMNARKFANEKNLNNIRFIQADAENTKLPDNSIDRIVCHGMLHHLDLSCAFPEMKRILKPGGKILAVESLDYNPLIKLYRNLTPDMRTEWEKNHILDLKDIEFARYFFKVKNINFWHILGYAGGKFPILQKPLDLLDRFLEKIPLFRRMAWIFTFELEKN